VTVASHLVVYEFGPDAKLEGQLVGALERIQALGRSRLLDGLFAAHDPDTGELAAIDLGSSTRADALAGFLTFRLDPEARRQATETALGDAGSVPAELIRSVGSALPPGGAMFVLLIERPEWRELGDAVSRTGGSMLRAEVVGGSTLAEAGPQLLAALSAAPPPRASP
jgi:hypothetical protein